MRHPTNVGWEGGGGLWPLRYASGREDSRLLQHACFPRALPLRFASTSESREAR